MANDLETEKLDGEEGKFSQGDEVGTPESLAISQLLAVVYLGDKMKLLVLRHGGQIDLLTLGSGVDDLELALRQMMDRGEIELVNSAIQQFDLMEDDPRHRLPAIHLPTSTRVDLQRIDVLDEFKYKDFVTAGDTIEMTTIGPEGRSETKQIVVEKLFEAFARAELSETVRHSLILLPVEMQWRVVIFVLDMTTEFEEKEALDGGQKAGIKILRETLRALINDLEPARGGKSEVYLDLLLGYLGINPHYIVGKFRDLINTANAKTKDEMNAVGRAVYGVFGGNVGKKLTTALNTMFEECSLIEFLSGKVQPSINGLSSGQQEIVHQLPGLSGEIQKAKIQLRIILESWMMAELEKKLGKGKPGEVIQVMREIGEYIVQSTSQAEEIEAQQSIGQRPSMHANAGGFGESVPISSQPTDKRHKELTRGLQYPSRDKTQVSLSWHGAEIIKPYRGCKFGRTVDLALSFTSRVVSYQDLYVNITFEGNVIYLRVNGSLENCKVDGVDVEPNRSGRLVFVAESTEVIYVKSSYGTCTFLYRKLRDLELLSVSSNQGELSKRQAIVELMEFPSDAIVLRRLEMVENYHGVALTAEEMYFEYAGLKFEYLGQNQRGEFLLKYKPVDKRQQTSVNTLDASVSGTLDNHRVPEITVNIRGGDINSGLAISTPSGEIIHLGITVGGLLVTWKEPKLTEENKEKPNPGKRNLIVITEEDIRRAGYWD